MKLILKLVGSEIKQKIQISPEEIEAILFLHKTLGDKVDPEAEEEIGFEIDSIFDNEGYGLFEAYPVKEEDRVA